MQSNIHINIDAPPLTPEQEEVARQALLKESAASEGGGPESFAVGFNSTFWTPGRTLRIRFMGGGDRARNKLMKAAKTWSEFANIKFVASEDKDAEIRISFKDTWTWSVIGTNALGLSHGDPTANCAGYKDLSDKEVEGSALMLFGTILGLSSEWVNPRRDIPWDREVVFAAYRAAGWKNEAIENYLFKSTDASVAQFSKFDPDSIMCAAIPEEWTKGQYRTKPNYELSETDKKFIAKIYPK